MLKLVLKLMPRSIPMVQFRSRDPYDLGIRSKIQP